MRGLRGAAVAKHVTHMVKMKCGTPSMQSDAKATFAVYSLRVDRLLLVQVPYNSIVSPMTALPPTWNTITMSVLAFR